MEKANKLPGYRMSLMATLALLLFSCHLREEKDTPKSSGPNVVEAHGYIVPTDSIAVPKVLPFDESKLLKVPAGKPKTVPVSSNVHIAGNPKTITAGTPRIYTPGQDTFKLPFTVISCLPFIALR